MSLNFLKTNFFHLVRKNVGIFTTATANLYHESAMHTSRLPVALPSSISTSFHLPQHESDMRSYVKLYQDPILSSKHQYLNSHLFPISDHIVKENIRIKIYKNPSKHIIVPIEEPFKSNLPLKTAKSDIKWRRRRMRRHK